MKDTGGTAFPVPGFVAANGETQWPVDGMTLRDYFASHAMQAEVASAGANEKAAQDLAEAAAEAGRSIEQQVAFNAYTVADAMIEARG